MIEMKTLTIGEGAQAKTYEIVDAAAREANETLDATLVELSARMDTAEESIELFVNTGITMQNGRLCVKVERS